MPRIIGRLTNIGIGKETTRGTAVAPQFWLPVRDLDFDDDLNFKDNESGFGTIDAIQDSGILQQFSQGGFEGKIYDQSEGALLGMLFGQGPTSVQRGATGTYDHSFTMLQSNQHRTGTVAIKEANNNLRYTNAVLDSYELEATLDDYVHRNINMMARKGVSATDTVALTNETEFLPKHINVKMANIAATVSASDTALTAASPFTARMVKLSVNKNAEILYALGSVDANDVVNKQLEVSGSIELYYDDLVRRNLVFNSTHQALRIEMINTDVVIGGSNNPALRFDLYEVIFTNWERGFDNNDIMTQTVEFKAVLNVAAGASIGARLTNQLNGSLYA